MKRALTLATLAATAILRWGLAQTTATGTTAPGTAATPLSRDNFSRGADREPPFSERNALSDFGRPRELYARSER